MSPAISALIKTLHDDVTRLTEENKELKQKLAYRHTEINDLRYAKRELIKRLENKF